MNYENSIKNLSEHFKVIAMDSPGHGRSSHVDSLSYQLLAENISMFIDKLELDSLYIMGWGDGGILGLLLAADRADKVKKLVAISANYNGIITYKQGFLSGVILTVFIALLSPLTQWITTYVITPEYFPNVIKRSVELGYYNTTIEAEANFNYQNYAIQGIIGALIMGFITISIAMIFIRTKNGKSS